MKMNFISRVAAILIGMQVITACELFLGDDCGSFDNTPYKVSSISHQVAILNREDNTVGSSPRVLLSYSEFGVLMDLGVEKVAQAAEPAGTLFSAAVACSPPPPYVDGTIDSVAIYADQPYRDNLTTGSNLVGFFDVAEIWINEIRPYSQFPAEDISDHFEPYAFPYSLWLFPTEGPSDELQNVSFRIVVYLSGSGLRSAEFSTDPVTLIP